MCARSIATSGSARFCIDSFPRICHNRPCSYFTPAIGDVTAWRIYPLCNQFRISNTGAERMPRPLEHLRSTMRWAPPLTNVVSLR